MDRSAIIALALAFAFTATVASAATTRTTKAQRCEATKLKVAGAYNLCLLKAQAKAVKPGAEISGDLAKCDSTFARLWARAERKGGASCPTSGDAASLQSILTVTAIALKGRLDLQRFVDHGDGTITDNHTGLMWEKKDGADGVANYGDPADVDNVYTCSQTDVMPDGTAFTEFLGQLNNCYLNAAGPTVVGGLGGHCDWRLPTFQELQGIFDKNQPNCPGLVPCIDPMLLPVAFQPTDPHGADDYWNSTGSALSTNATALGFGFTTLSAEPKV